MEIWYHIIKSIEGQFGSGVAVYFKFLRWLILLNIIFALVRYFLIFTFCLFYIYILQKIIFEKFYIIFVHL